MSEPNPETATWESICLWFQKRAIQNAAALAASCDELYGANVPPAFQAIVNRQLAVAKQWKAAAATGGQR